MINCVLNKKSRVYFSLEKKVLLLYINFLIYQKEKAKNGDLYSLVDQEETCGLR